MKKEFVYDYEDLDIRNNKLNQKDYVLFFDSNCKTRYEIGQRGINQYNIRKNNIVEYMSNYDFEITGRPVKELILENFEERITYMICNNKNVGNLFKEFYSTFKTEIENKKIKYETIYLNLGYSLSTVLKLASLYSYNQLRELLGYKVDMNDLVLFINSDYKYEYGLVISDKAVFTEEGKKKKPSFVIKLHNLNAKEYELKKKLYEKFYSSVRLYDDKNLNVGSLYKQGNLYFLNLGIRKMTGGTIPPATESNFILDFKINENLPLWIVIDEGHIGNKSKLLKGDTNYLYHLIKEECKNNLVLIEKRIFVMNGVYSKYYSISDVSNFCQEFKGRSKFINTYDIKNNLCFDFYDFRLHLNLYE